MSSAVLEKRALNIGLIVLGVGSRSGDLWDLEPALIALTRFFERTGQKMADQSHTEADEENADCFSQIADQIESDALPSLRCFLESQDAIETAEERFQQLQDIRRKLKREELS